MYEEIMTDPDPLRCECRSEEICLAYSAPVFVYVKNGDVTKVVVADEETQFGSVARCLACDRFWILNEEPEVGIWPQWEFTS